MAEMNSTFAALATFMESIGMSSLFSYQNGQPSGWLWSQVQDGITDPDALLISLQQTDEFKQRFPVIAEQQLQAAQGKYVGYVMTPKDVLNYEQAVSEAMRSAGLPVTFYDEPSDFVELMRTGVPYTDVIDRIEIAFDTIADAPSEVRNMFEDYFGVGQGDAALAAYVLDPDMLTTRLERERNAAFAGAVGARYDLQLSREQAMDIAEVTGSAEAAQEGVEMLGQRQALFGERIGEGSYASVEREGLAATFGLDTGISQVDAQQELDRILQERQRLGRQAGGAVVTQEGVTGLG